MTLAPDLLVFGMDLGDVLYIAIFLIVVFGGWVTSMIKQLAARRQAAERARTSGPASRLDELAAKRRAQLRQMAGRDVAAGTTSASSEPENMTMAERIARARAKAQYEKRAADLHQQKTAQRQPQASAQASPPQPVRSVPSTRHRPSSQPREELRVRRVEQVRRQQVQQQAQKQSRPPVGVVRPAPVSASMLNVAAAHEPLDTGMSVVHRNVSDAPTTEVTHRGMRRRMRLNISRMKQSDWRRAIVVKEILDSPLALRF